MPIVRTWKATNNDSQRRISVSFCFDNRTCQETTSYECNILLKDLQVALGIPEDLRFPLGTKSSEIEDVIDKSVEKVQKSLDYYKTKPPDYKDALFMLFQKSYARKYLTYVTFVAAVAVALLSVIEIGVMISRHSTQG